MTKRLFKDDDVSIRFVNTIAWRLRDQNEERLGSPEALLEWLSESGIAAPREIKAVQRTWNLRRDAATKAYGTAIRLREAIYCLFIARIGHVAPPRSETEFLSLFLWQRSSGLRLEWDGKRSYWHPDGNNPDALDLLRPVALSAAELLTGNRAHKIRQCQDNRGCGWLFVDESRLQNRRWCSMGDCGNLAKARRHRERLRTR
jgi:predicted RNA-binding Zn ribbon-like protein